jgi:hypothetical protein
VQVVIKDLKEIKDQKETLALLALKVLRELQVWKDLVERAAFQAVLDKLVRLVFLDFLGNQAQLGRKARTVTLVLLVPRDILDNQDFKVHEGLPELMVILEQLVLLAFLDYKAFLVFPDQKAIQAKKDRKGILDTLAAKDQKVNLDQRGTSDQQVSQVLKVPSGKKDNQAQPVIKVAPEPAVLQVLVDPKETLVMLVLQALLVVQV